MYKTRLLTSFASFILVAALFFAFTQNSSAGGVLPPVEPGCCQGVNSETGAYLCENVDFECGAAAFPIVIIGFFEGESCNEQTGLCSGFVIESSVPTLSEWGLIAMAAILGVKA